MSLNLKMHLSENEGIEKKTFVVTGGLGFVGSALCLELVRRGAHQVRAFDLRSESLWSDNLRRSGVRFIQGSSLFCINNCSLQVSRPIFVVPQLVVFGAYSCNCKQYESKCPLS